MRNKTFSVSFPPTFPFASRKPFNTRAPVAADGVIAVIFLMVACLMLAALFIVRRSRQVGSCSLSLSTMAVRYSFFWWLGIFISPFPSQIQTESAMHVLDLAMRSSSDSEVSPPPPPV